MSSPEKFYDALSSSYSSISRKRLLYLESIERIVNLVLSNSKGGKLLDIGSGDGLRIQRITAGTGINVTAIESSKEMCKLLRKNSGISKVYPLDISEFTEERLQFQNVTALWNVFGHVQKIQTSLKNAFNSLEYGGKMIFDVNNALNVGEYGIIAVIRNFFTFIFIKPEIKFKLVNNDESTWVYFRSHWFYKKVLKQIGFKEIRFFYIDYENGAKASLFSGQLLVICTK